MLWVILMLILMSTGRTRWWWEDRRPPGTTWRQSKILLNPFSNRCGLDFARGAHADETAGWILFLVVEDPALKSQDRVDCWCFACTSNLCCIFVGSSWWQRRSRGARRPWLPCEFYPLHLAKKLTIWRKVLHLYIAYEALGPLPWPHVMHDNSPLLLHVRATIVQIFFLKAGENLLKARKSPVHQSQHSQESREKEQDFLINDPFESQGNTIRSLLMRLCERAHKTCPDKVE